MISLLEILFLFPPFLPKCWWVRAKSVRDFFFFLFKPLEECEEGVVCMYVCIFRCLGHQRYSVRQLLTLQSLDQRPVFNKRPHETGILIVIHSLFFCTHYSLYPSLSTFGEAAFQVSFFPQPSGNCCGGPSNMVLLVDNQPNNCMDDLWYLIVEHFIITLAPWILKYS